MKTKRVLIMAAGTGGHIFPALSVAKALQAQGYETIWLGTKTGLENKFLAKENLQFFGIDMPGIRGKGLLKKMLSPFFVLRAWYQALGIMLKTKPALVLGFGGYVTVPGALAAYVQGIPIILHEQNAIAGLSNRFLIRLAKIACYSFPGTFHQAKAILTGNPLRPELLNVAAPEQRLHREKLKLLILGGSQGAMIFNQTVAEALAKIPQHLRPDVLHQTGLKNLEATQKYYQDKQVKAEIVAFIENMSEVYSSCDLLLSRAGATTVAEIAGLGLASILVPYPYATDDHQRANAQFLSEAGAAVLCPQTEFTADFLAKQLQDFGQNRDKIREMAQKAYQLGVKDATFKIMNICLGELCAKGQCAPTTKPKHGKD